MMRNVFGALKDVPGWARELVNRVEKAGVFETGIASDKRGRGSSVNVDVFGHDETQHLVVIQVRECVFHPGKFNRVRKDYYLIGTLEDGEPFAHPIETPARSKKGMSSPESCVKFVQTKLWGCDEEDLPYIIRQGDVAFVPARLPKDAEPIQEEEIILAGSHRLRAETMWRKGNDIFVTKASLTHLPRQHSSVRLHSGVRRVVVASRAKTWGFSAPTAD